MSENTIDMKEYPKELNKLTIAIDFDGTCVTHEYPKIGKDIGAASFLRELSEDHNIILYTMRSGDTLWEAVEWLTSNGIKLFGINRNYTQDSWTTSPKVYANIYIDDAALGCPLKIDKSLSNRPFVDWKKVKEIYEATTKKSL